MNTPTDDGAPGAAGIDTGEPIAELAELTAEPRTGFLGRLWQRIDRRRLGGEFTEFGWSGLYAVFIEFLSMAMEMFKTRPPADSAAGDRGDES